MIEMFPRSMVLADLAMVITNLEEIRDRLIAECQEHGADYTPKQEGKFEGAFLMVRGILADELYRMQAAYEGGGAFSRKGEEILAAVEPVEPADKAWARGYEEGYARALKDAQDAVSHGYRDAFWSDGYEATDALGDVMEALDRLA